MDATASRAEAERLLGISEKLLHTRDLSGAREFALLAQETEPLLEGSDQILAISDVLIAAGKRVNNNPPDWYSILQVERRSDDSDLIRKNYRRLALLLHPDKNRFPLADSAFNYVSDAWGILSNATKKSKYDNDTTVFTKVDLAPKPSNQSQYEYQQTKTPVRRSPRAAPPSGASPSPGVRGGSNTAAATITRAGAQDGNNAAATTAADTRANSRTSTFWTACPYCYVLYEYPKTYEDCCLKCQSCERGFHAAALPSLPPRVPGKEAYYCCWGFFPLGFKIEDGTNTDRVDANHTDNGNNNNNNNQTSAFPNWMPPIFNSTPGSSSAMPAANDAAQPPVRATVASARVATQAAGAAGVTMKPSAPKRGRPRKNPIS